MWRYLDFVPVLQIGRQQAQLPVGGRRAEPEERRGRKERERERQRGHENRHKTRMGTR